MPRSALAAVFLLAMALFAPSPSTHAAELLTNNGFEQGIDPWQSNRGQLSPVNSPVQGGSVAARLAGSEIQSHEVYRWVEVAPDEVYQLSAWVLLDHAAVERTFLRVSWFDSNGGPVAQADSPWLTLPSPQFQFVTTGSVTSPAAAASARVGAWVQGNGAFEVYFDDFSFTGAVPPPPTPPPTASPAPVVTTSPSATPPPASRTPTPTPPPAATTPTGEEPEVFDALTNAGFETLRDDGTPYAWKDIGADLRAVTSPVAEGGRALGVVSRTTSTKWAYQTVRVQAGQYYEAAGYFWSGAYAETFLRVSWYRTEDGSGPAIDSADSTEISPPGGRFEHLTTGPIQAPSDALTAKVRLMLRPASGAETIAYYDAITFGPTTARPQAGTVGEGASAGSRPNSGASLSVASNPRGEAGPAAEPLVERYPLGFANVKPVPTSPPSSVGSGSGGYDWLAAAAIAVGAAAVAFAVLLEKSHRRRDRPGGT